MIIQTGMRTDIPAFYSEWLLYTDRTGACYGIFAGKFGTSVFIFPVLGRLSGKPHSSDTGSLMRRAEAWIGRKK